MISLHNISTCNLDKRLLQINHVHCPVTSPHPIKTTSQNRHMLSYSYSLQFQKLHNLHALKSEACKKTDKKIK